MTAPTPEVVNIDGEQFYQMKAVLRVPKNWTPESGVFIAVCPPGGVGNFPALAQGEPGMTPNFRYIEVTELEWEDETPMSATFTSVSPGTPTTPPVYDMHLTLRKGQAGDDGTMTILGASDLDDTGIADGLIFAVKAVGGVYSVELVSMRVGGYYWPVSVETALASATGSHPRAAVTVPPQLNPWWPVCAGQVELAPNGVDVQADLVARLDAVNGPVVARGMGLANGARQILALAAAPPIGSVGNYGQVAAGVAAVIYFRCEQVGSGLSTYGTIAGREHYGVQVLPVG